MPSECSRVLVPLIALVPCLGAQVLAQATTTRVSVSSFGSESNGHSGNPSISDDGRFVVFDSTASNLVPNDTNGQADVFLHDLTTLTTVRLSEGPGGVQGNGISNRPFISGSGRIVVFSTWASTLVPGSNGQYHAVAVDLQTGTLELISISPAGMPLPGTATSVSGSGRFVGFVPSTGVGYVRDRLTGSTLTTQAGPDSAAVRASDDGRFVAWHGTTYPARVVLEDRQTSALWTFMGTGTGSGAGNCFAPILSRDGRFLTFCSSAPLLPFDHHVGDDLYLFDRVAASLAILTPTGMPGGHNGSLVKDPAMSADQSCVTYTTDATDMIPGTTGAGLVLQRLDTGAREIVSLTTAGLPCGAGVDRSALSGTGRYVAFASLYSTLVPGDSNGVTDIFVRDRWFPSPVVYCEAKVNSQGCAPLIGAAGTPGLAGPDDFHITASLVRNQSPGILFWGTAPDFVPFAGGTRCVRTPLIRTPIQVSGGSMVPDCSGTYDFHFSDGYMASYLLTPGTSLYAQWWQRDAAHPDGTGQGLTNGLEFTVSP